MVVLATAPAEVHLSTGRHGAVKKYAVREGLAKLAHPLVAGESMRAAMIRQGVVVAECTPEQEGFVVEEQPRTYNFNAYVAMSA